MCVCLNRQTPAKTPPKDNKDLHPIQQVKVEYRYLIQASLPLFFVTLLLARLMGQYCIVGCRLSSSVTLPAGGPAGRRARGRSAAGRVVGRTADTALRASHVTSR